ncbi:hypothetical protein H312_00578 [Anncaliia algerae PRA339]|uniref:Uncharacterized protein n=1 Tax=Anncaliia algerae PRA339 TaxID=1288291 RepID=A0A059F408_9MICR|nr:hypothetical protein H312_00578 [Anncaliia algerae PRA339]
MTMFMLLFSIIIAEEIIKISDSIAIKTLLEWSNDLTKGKNSKNLEDLNHKIVGVIKNINDGSVDLPELNGIFSNYDSSSVEDLNYHKKKYETIYLFQDFKNLLEGRIHSIHGTRTPHYLLEEYVYSLLNKNNDRCTEIIENKFLIILDQLINEIIVN